MGRILDTRATLSKLAALRGPGETFSHVILRLAAERGFAPAAIAPRGARPWFLGAPPKKMEQMAFHRGWYVAMHPMILDRPLQLEYLELTNRHVAEGQKRIERQRGFVVRLQEAGRDADQALILLSEFQQSLALHIQRRNRILSDLGMRP